MFVAKAFQRPDIPRARQEAEALLDAGYPVYVLAWDRNAEFPARENVAGAMVLSFTPLNLRRFSRLRLALGGLLFQIVLFFEAIRLISEIRQRPIIHAHDINTLVLGYLLRAVRLSHALVYDCREFTYGLYYEWYNLFVACILRVVEQICLRHVDAVITVSDPIATYLRRFNPVTRVIYNCPRAKDVPRLTKSDARMRLRLPEKAFVVSSVGTIRYDCRFDLLLAVASLTKSEDVYYVVVGEGPLASELRQTARQKNCTSLGVFPRVPRETALTYIIASDLTWAVYQNRAESFNPRMTIPWKFFESLACGVPLIVDAGTFRAQLVRQLGCGLVLESDDPKDVARMILSLAKYPASHEKLCAEARHASTSMNFNWEAMATRLIEVYMQLERHEPGPRIRLN
jgi:glycosyltransferase involved in cell wall biosynthesis